MCSKIDINGKESNLSLLATPVKYWSQVVLPIYQIHTYNIVCKF